MVFLKLEADDAGRRLTVGTKTKSIKASLGLVVQLVIWL